MEDELNRADEELSYSPPVEPELLVPPLPLFRVNAARLMAIHLGVTYRFFGAGLSNPANRLSWSSVGEWDG